MHVLLVVHAASNDQPLPLPENENSLWDHDLLSLPLPYDCLPVLYRALQSL